MKGRGWQGWRNLKIVNGRIVLDDKSPKVNKYHNEPCVADDIRFQSKRERDYYLRNLLPRYRAGEVKWFLRQTRFDLPGGIIYRADFLEIWKDGSIHVTDVKGRRTYPYKMKKKLVENSYPIRIEEK